MNATIGASGSNDSRFRLRDFGQGLFQLALNRALSYLNLKPVEICTVIGDPGT
jgi:hypothetical protein